MYGTVRKLKVLTTHTAILLSGNQDAMVWGNKRIDIAKITGMTPA